MFSRSSRFISIFLFALIFLPLTGKIYAQLDPTFGTNGVVTANLGADDATLANFVLPDGKIFVVSVAFVGFQQKTFLLNTTVTERLIRPTARTERLSFRFLFLTPTERRSPVPSDKRTEK